MSDDKKKEMKRTHEQFQTFLEESTIHSLEDISINVLATFKFKVVPVCFFNIQFWCI